MWSAWRLFTEQDRDDQRAFRESGDEERLNQHFTGSAWVAADSFASFEADESEGDGGTESGAGDGDVTSHCIWVVLCVSVDWMSPQSLPRSGIQERLVAVFGVLVVVAHE